MFVNKGEITGIDKMHIFYGYTDRVKELQAFEKTTGIKIGLPFVDFTIKINDVIVPDTMYSFKKNQKIVFRMLLEHNDVYSQQVIDELSGNTIFFLKRNPDNKTYGYLSDLHRVKIKSEDDLSVSSEAGDIHPLGISNHKAFVDAIKKTHADR